MPDTVATLSAALQTQLSGSGPQISTMTQLMNALIVGTIPMATARATRRVGLLNTATAGQYSELRGRCYVEDVAACFTEVREVASFRNMLWGFNTNIAKLNPVDSTGAHQVNAGPIPQTDIVNWANQLVAFATTYENFETETLPS